MVDNMKINQKNAREKKYTPLLAFKDHSNFLKNINFLKNDTLKDSNYFINLRMIKFEENNWL